MQGSQPSKQFRWVGTLSEEELLGVPVIARRTAMDATIRPADPPPRRPLDPAPIRGRRLHKRDILSVLAVGAAVWLAVGGAGHGLRFPGSASDAPEAIGSTSSSVVVDRDPIASLPRLAPANNREIPPGAGGREQGTKGKGGKHDSNSPRADEGGEPAEPPLAEVTVPRVGTVSVEQPAVPELPDTEAVVPATPSIPLP
jgi:hypothetical protein